MEKITLCCPSLLVSGLVFLVACSGSSSSPQTSGGTTGAQGGSSTGGVDATTSGSGGVGGGAGSMATGGVNSAGGSTNTGGMSAKGGTNIAGSASSTGGVTSSGGAVAGGATSRGGVSGMGGGSSSGGVIGTGGRAGNGGTTGTGGAGAGGSTAPGGSGGPSRTGGGPGNGGIGGGDAGPGGASGVGGDMPPVYTVENTGADCTVSTTFSAFSALTSIANFPDPFLMDSGTRMASRADWKCRRNEISAQVQHWGSGPKGAPPSNLTATYSGGKLTVVVTQGSASITLSSTITTPSGAGPFPVVIGMNTPTGSLPSSIFSAVATMTFTSSQMGISDPMNVTRGAGTYFSMYPDTNAGAMIEWAWGVSRLIDGLYKTADQNKLDLNHIAVTGCSFQGKMALYAGAFDERIALTIPEESGGGGEAAWRFMATQTGTEDLEAAQGTAWYAANLKQFKNADAPKLPYDQHELVAMVAPRAILAVENTAIDRLGSQAGGASMKAATEVYKALGIPDRIGYTQAAATAHCSFPSSQGPDVQAFVDKFLLGKTSANTAIAKCSYNTDMTKWITWETPTLK